MTPRPGLFTRLYRFFDNTWGDLLLIGIVSLIVGLMATYLVSR